MILAIHHPIDPPQVGEEPIIQPTPPKRKRKQLSKGEGDDAADPRSAPKRKLAPADASKPRKVRI